MMNRPVTTQLTALAVACLLALPLCSVRAQTITLDEAAPEPVSELTFNFQGVPVSTVLDYMSQAAGFIIVRTVPVEGRVDIVSHQPVGPDEAVALLNKVLYERGYAAIRNGRVLTIVNRDEARTRNIPVRLGNVPEAIPPTEEMVTQIIPVRHANAKDMVADLQRLLPSYATISANESSNALVLTDTQSSVRRIAEIVQALDQSISDISTLRVFQLQHADAKQTATLIQDIFTQQSSRAANARQIISQFRGMGGGDQRGGTSSNADSAALQASSRVTASADERTNSVVVSAPDSLIPTIETLIASIDQSSAILTDVRVFPLRFANATETATIVTNLFNQTTQQSSRSNQRSQQFRGPGGQAAQPANQQSARQQAENTVLAVADVRTNSIIVSAVPGVMANVAQVITELDTNPAQAKQVHVYSLRNAKPEEVAAMLQQMFGSTSTGTTNRAGTNTGRTTTNTQRNTGTQGQTGTTARRTGTTGR